MLQRMFHEGVDGENSITFFHHFMYLVLHRVNFRELEGKLPGIRG